MKPHCGQFLNPDDPMSLNPFDETHQKAISFYTSRYALATPLFLRPGQKLYVGSKEHRVCRFCDRQKPEVTFRQKAHAIPELLGNKVLFSYYECDACNGNFGRGIENDLGNWSKASRSFARIAGKNGVPSLHKSAKEPGWSISYDPKFGHDIKQYEQDPAFEVDEVNQRIIFHLVRDPYTPVAVLKAFVKVALTLMPEEEISQFSEAIKWIGEIDHSKSFLDKFPLIWTFLPGHMPNDLITVWLLRRKPSVSDVPYAFMILAYGNDVFQVAIPSLQQDQIINGKNMTIPPFPTPGSPNPERYGRGITRMLNLTGTSVIRGEKARYVMRYETKTDPV